MMQEVGASMVSLASSSVTDSVTADMGVFEMSFGRRPLGLRERGVVVEGEREEGPMLVEGGLDAVVPDGGRERPVEEERERRPEARRDITGEGGAGRDDVREVVECVLNLWTS